MWIRFETAGEPAPSMQLPVLSGAPVTVSDLRERANALVVFGHGPACPACAALIDALVAQQNAIQQNDAEVIVVLPKPEVVVPPQWAGLHVLADPTGALRNQYTALIEFETPRAVMVFVLNQYTVPHAAWVGAEADPSLVAAALEWLEIVVYKCAACSGKSGWPGRSAWEEVDLPDWEN